MAFSTNTARHAAAITTSDTANNVAQAIYIGGAGNLAVITSGGDTVTFTNLPAGAIFPVSVTKVLATGTTATGLVGLRD